MPRHAKIDPSTLTPITRVGGGPDPRILSVIDPIDRKYNRMGGAASFLGNPTTELQPTPDGVGRYRHYQGGSIYSHPQLGEHEVHGAIRDRWAALGWERSYLGYPRTDEQDVPGGIRVSHFQSGSIYWSARTGVIEVRGAFDDPRDPCAELRSELGKAQEERARRAGGSGSGTGAEPGEKPRPGPRDREDSGRDGRIATLVTQLNACESQPVHLAPLTLRVTGIRCTRQNDAGLLGIGESDEPYVLVYVLTWPSFVPLNPPTPPTATMTLIGPIDNVEDDGQSHTPPPDLNPPIWGIERVPMPIADPDQLFIGVVVMEHDETDVAAVRENLELLMGTEVLSNLPLVGNRDEFARRMLDGLTGFANDAAIAVSVNPDDRIGRAQELRITRHHLHLVHYQGRTALSLSFVDETAAYHVDFLLSRN